ncbi:MAG: hypothetical protein MPJ50_02640 [Pirellulales bacterium]|nr:hypothetical protein [Pirellulales bacterium]
MHRPTVGIIAILLFVTAAGLFPFASQQTSTVWMLFSACLKVGILMSVVWLAQPHLVGFPWWLLLIAGIVAVAVLAIRQPRPTLLLIAIVIVVLRVRNFLARPPQRQ